MLLLLSIQRMFSIPTTTNSDPSLNNLTISSRRRSLSPTEKSNTNDLPITHHQCVPASVRSRLLGSISVKNLKGRPLGNPKTWVIFEVRSTPQIDHETATMSSNIFLVFIFGSTYGSQLVASTIIHYRPVGGFWT